MLDGRLVARLRDLPACVTGSLVVYTRRTTTSSNRQAELETGMLDVIQKEVIPTSKGRTHSRHSIASPLSLLHIKLSMVVIANFTGDTFGSFRHAVDRHSLSWPLMISKNLPDPACELSE